jgi:hypothetical protein
MSGWFDGETDKIPDTIILFLHDLCDLSHPTYWKLTGCRIFWKVVEIEMEFWYFEARIVQEQRL